MHETWNWKLESTSLHLSPTWAVPVFFSDPIHPPHSVENLNIFLSDSCLFLRIAVTKPGVSDLRPQGLLFCWLFRNPALFAPDSLNQVCFANKKLQWHVRKNVGHWPWRLGVLHLRSMAALTTVLTPVPCILVETLVTYNTRNLPSVPTCLHMVLHLFLTISIIQDSPKSHSSSLLINVTLLFNLGSSYLNTDHSFTPLLSKPPSL